MLFLLDDKIKIFKKIIQDGNLSQAYLFYGESKVGKYTFSKALAYYLEYKEFDILEKPLIDFKEVLPLNDKKNIGIDEIKEIKNFLYQKPFRSIRRFVLIDQKFNLTKEAQSALLKILEEPPLNSLIILISDDYNKFLSPVVSRLIKIYFRRSSKEEIKNILINFFYLKEKKAEEISQLSFGQIGRALDILLKEKENNYIEENNLENLINYLDDLILNFYFKNKIKYSNLIKWLLEKKQELANFNLNPVLQKKVIELKLKIYESINRRF